MSRPPLIYAPPCTPYLSVLHHDDDLVIVDKPSGLLSVPGRDPALSDCIEARVRSRFEGASIVHRLDLETSGIMILARNREAHRNISRQFERREVEKVYTADVWGIIADDHGLVDAALICDWPNRPRQIIDPVNGRSALTAWQVVSRGPSSSRLHLMPKTGRSHQLRVHMQSLGHPILGDSLYAHDAAFSATTRLHLHATRLSLRHPTSGDRLTFESLSPF